MGRLICTRTVSLDGFIATPDPSLDRTVADVELHTWSDDRARELAASLYGCRPYPRGAVPPVTRPIGSCLHW